MAEQERRKGYERPGRAMERDLTLEQVVTLRQLESYGWELKFVRRVPFQPPQAVLSDSDRRQYAVLLADGDLDERPAITIRPGARAGTVVAAEPHSLTRS